MKTIKFIVLASAVISLGSCEIDNFAQPNAELSGSFIDIQTGELIQQDIVNGTKIRFVELGWDNPEQQQMVVMCDGTYRNTKMFAASYDFYFEECNFIPPVRLSNQTIKKGKNVLDFEVQPYIRIPGASIKKEGDKIVARFIVEPTVNTPVESIGLFAHTDYAVGAELSHARTQVNIGTTINGHATYTLEIDLTAGDGQNLEAGKTYYFRVGAKVTTAGSKYNYAPAVQITI